MHCKIKEKLKIKTRSVFEEEFMAAIKERLAQIKALKSDGEKPANQTNKMSAIILIK